MGLAGTNSLGLMEIEHSSPMGKHQLVKGMMKPNLPNIKTGNHLFRQPIGIFLGINCVPLLANLFLYSYEVECLRSMKKSNKKLAKAFNLISCYIDDLIGINNPRFKQFLKDIYPEELVVSETSE